MRAAESAGFEAGFEAGSAVGGCKDSQGERGEEGVGSLLPKGVLQRMGLRGGGAATTQGFLVSAVSGLVEAKESGCSRFTFLKRWFSLRSWAFSFSRYARRSAILQLLRNALRWEVCHCRSPLPPTTGGASARHKPKRREETQVNHKPKQTDIHTHHEYKVRAASFT